MKTAQGVKTLACSISRSPAHRGTVFQFIMSPKEEGSAAGDLTQSPSQNSYQPEAQVTSEPGAVEMGWKSAKASQGG